jgi:BlaI family penicillinase repressor
MHFSEAEWKVMKVLWQQHPASVRDVLEALAEDTGWAYSTVKTLLARLVEKGAVGVHKRANASLFEPLVAAPEAQRSALRALLDRAFDGTFGALVHHLVAEEKLSPQDRDELRALLEAEDPAVKRGEP